MDDAGRPRGVGRLHYLTLGFGTIIGSAWVVLLGGWLAEAGPGGAMLGLIAGGLAIALIGRCYAELIPRFPEAGGEFIYAYRLFGPAIAFPVGWFLLLYLVGVTVYEALALGQVTQMLVPLSRGMTLYTVLGTPVTLGGLTVGIGALAAVTLANLKGVAVVVRLHGALTFGFLAAALLVMAWLGATGDVANARPWFGTATGLPWWHGAIALFAFSAYGYYGFQAIPQIIEERSSRLPLQAVASIVGAAIGVAMLFYCAVILAVSIGAPWRETIRAPLAPVAAALVHHRWLATLLLLATAMSLLKAWNGIFMMAVRLAMAMARTGLLPESLRRVGADGGIPHAATIGIAAATLFGQLFGQGAIVPITDMCEMVLASTYILCCIAVIRLRRRQGRRIGPAVWGALAVAVVMTGASFMSPFLRSGSAMPPECWLLLGWAGAGAVVWRWLSPAARPVPAC